MRVSDFHFDLPDELIARYPKEDRSSCRLLPVSYTHLDVYKRQY